MLRLLKLPDFIQKDVSSGALSEGHGRALVRLADDPMKIQEIREVILNNDLSVRQAEKIIKKAFQNRSSDKKEKLPSADGMPQSYINALATQLTNFLNSKVLIQQNGTRGKIEIEYYSFDDLERVFGLLLSGEKDLA